MNSSLPITEEWLREVGFKWHQLERQPEKMWLLWLGDAVFAGTMFMCFEDLGITVSHNRDGRWSCWLRGDYSHRYSRFIFVRDMRYQGELIKLAEAITGQEWDPANHLYGSLLTPEQAARLKADDQERQKRLDQQMLQPTWRETEKDESRGRPLIEHLEAAEKARTEGKK
jgi:hypothetical protein